MERMYGKSTEERGGGIDVPESMEVIVRAY